MCSKTNALWVLKKIFVILVLFFVFSGSVFAKNNQSALPMDSQDYQKTQEAIRNTFGNGSGVQASKTLSTDKDIQKMIGCNGVCTKNNIKKYQKEHGLTEDGIIGAETLSVIQKEKAKKNGNSNDYSDDSKAHAENMACSYNGEGDIMVAMKGCVSGTTPNGKPLSLVGVDDTGDMKVGEGFKTKIMEWTKKIGGFLGLGAIFAIAFGSLKITLSGGEEEGIKKGKDIIKWGVLGFLLVVSAGFIVGVVVNVIYGVLG